MDWLQFFSFVVAGLLLWVWMLNTRPKNFPPGPWGLPLVGYYPFLGSLPAKKLAELGKKYGSIYSLNIGSKYAVVLNDWKAVKEALIDQNENFSGRPVTYTFNEVRNRTDISSCDGDGWKVKRNFTLQALKTFGFGKASMENLIADEVRISMKQLKSKAGQKVNMHKFFFGAFLNIVWVTAAGSRIELPEKEEKKLYDDIATLMEQASNTNPLQFAPRWKYIPKYRKQHLNYMSSHNAMYSFLDQKVDEHIATYKDGHLRDFIDLFLAESEKRKKSNLNTEFFQRDHLRGILYNLNNGGVDTGNSTLEYSILYMITWPEVQHKVQEELDRVIGRDRMACWEDRKI